MSLFAYGLMIFVIIGLLVSNWMVRREEEYFRNNSGVFDPDYFVKCAFITMAIFWPIVVAHEIKTFLYKIYLAYLMKKKVRRIIKAALLIDPDNEELKKRLKELK